MKNFRHYKVRLARLFGHETAKRTVSQALFSISSGTDDFANNYFINPLTMRMYTLEQFQDLLLNSLSEFIQVEVFSHTTTSVSSSFFKTLGSINVVFCQQNISREGATKLAVVSLPPFGCLPSQIALHNITGNKCVEEFNEVASSFNAKMKALVERIKPKFSGVVAYVDTYDTLLDIVKSPTKYGKLHPRFTSNSKTS